MDVSRKHPSRAPEQNLQATIVYMARRQQWRQSLQEINMGNGEKSFFTAKRIKRIDGGNPQQKLGILQLWWGIFVNHACGS